MAPFRFRFRSRRGASMAVAIFGITATMGTMGLEMDSCRIATTRHKDQIIADAMTMSAMLKLPYSDQAIANANRVKALYQANYNTSFTTTLTFYPEGSSVPTSVKCDVSEPVPMLFGSITNTDDMGAAAKAAGGKVVPSALLQGAVPLGFQYDDPVIQIGSTALSSSTQLQLKMGNGEKKLVSGNCYALDFVAGSGASDWSEWVKFGYTARLETGDIIRTKPGNMNGPTDAALVKDLDSRMNRALVYPYADDTYAVHENANPRIIYIPLVDWKSARGGTSELQVKGFGAFWVDEFSQGSGRIMGRFIRQTVSKHQWEGVSIDPSIDPSYDNGFWAAQMSE